MNKTSWEKVFGSEQDKAYFSRVDRQPPKKGRAFVGWLFFLLLLAGTGMIVSSIVFGGDTPSARFGERVVITSDAPESVQAGKEIPVTLEIKNNESTALKNARLSVRIPNGVSFVSSQPSGEGQLVVEWPLGTIEPRHTSTIQTIWRFEGEEGANRRMTFTVQYQLEGFSLTLSQSTDIDFRLGEPAMRLLWEGPEKALPQDTIAVKLKYENTTENVITGLRIDVTVPTELKNVEYKPAPARLGSWDIPSVDPHAQGEIELSFKIPEGNTPLLLAAGIGTKTAQGNVLYQMETDYIVNRSTPAAGFNVTIGEWQKIVPISLTLANTETMPLKDVLFELTVVTNGYVLDGLTFDKTPAVQERLEQEKLVKVFTWSGTLLGELAPEQEMRITGSWSPPTSFRAASGNAKPENVFVEFRGRMTAKLERDGNTRTIARETSPYVHKVSSAVEISAISHTQGADKELVMSIKNGTNKIENVDMTIKLLEGATWKSAGEVGAGTITYDEATRLVHWKINWLPAYIGTDKPLEARALVVRNSSGNSFGDWQLTAKDSFTGENINVTNQ